MSDWILKGLNHFLIQKKRQIIIDSESHYSLVTITNKGEVKLREKLKGNQIGADKAFVAKSGDFIYSRLAVHLGAFGIVPEELDGALVTSEMPCFEIITNNIIPEILIAQLKADSFRWQLKQLTKGVGRIRVKESLLLKLNVLKGPLDKQLKLSKKISLIQENNNKLIMEIKNQKYLLKKIRERILQEAIEGKLTTGWRIENPNVEPAHHLLERITAERMQFIQSKKIKPQKPLMSVTNKEKSFELPDRWQWCRFGEYAFFERGKFSIRPRNDASCFGGKYPFIQIGALDSTGSLVDTYKQTLNEKGYAASRLFEKGTIMVAIVGGTIANLGVLNRDMCFPDSIVGVRPRPLTNQQYILLLLRHFQPVLKSLSYQMAGQPNIKLPTLNNLVCGLPPLLEQTAIVDRVNNIFTLCDELESQINENQTHAEQMMQAVFKEAFNQSESGLS